MAENNGTNTLFDVLSQTDLTDYLQAIVAGEINAKYSFV